MNTLLTKELIDKAESEQLIELDREQTAKFYDERAHWGTDVRVSQKKGDMVHIEWMATPDRRGHTKERYFIGSSEIKPAFAYWGLANAVRGRGQKYVS